MGPQPEWAADTLFASAQHRMPWPRRLLAALHIVLGGPVRSRCVQHTKNQIGRVEGYIEFTTDWPSLLVPWRRWRAGVDTVEAPS